MPPSPPSSKTFPSPPQRDPLHSARSCLSVKSQSSSTLLQTFRQGLSSSAYSDLKKGNNNNRPIPSDSVISSFTVTQHSLESLTSQPPNEPACGICRFQLNNALKETFTLQLILERDDLEAPLPVRKLFFIRLSKSESKSENKVIKSNNNVDNEFIGFTSSNTNSLNECHWKLQYTGKDLKKDLWEYFSRKDEKISVDAEIKVRSKGER